jgi:CubicO group peptidase (beta-lactamase class C family)
LVEGKVANILAAQKPFWTPGSKQGYHAQTMGFLIGELIKRVTGVTLGQYFKQNIAQKFDIDFHIGLPEKEEERFVICPYCYFTVLDLTPPPFPPSPPLIFLQSVLYRICHARDIRRGERPSRGTPMHPNLHSWARS